LTEQTLEIPRQSYWKTHEYKRMNVELIKGFVGYDYIMQLINLCSCLRDQAFLACLFLTGGRVGEVLKLTVANFKVVRKEGRLEVEGMFLSKRYRREYLDEERKTWKTIKLQGVTRDPFPIRLDEPPVAVLLEWIEQCKQNKQSLLFESSYGKGDKPLSRIWAYKLCRKLDRIMSHILHQNLGLDLPLTDLETGKVLKEQLNLWLHWFRSQRACCLVAVFGFDVLELVDWFKWKDIETALHYARLGAGKLADKMSKAEDLA
jgi:hypothetical protein